MGRPGDLDEAAQWERENDCDAGIMLAAALSGWQLWAREWLGPDADTLPAEHRDALMRTAIGACLRAQVDQVAALAAARVEIDGLRAVVATLEADLLDAQEAVTDYEP